MPYTIETFRGVSGTVNFKYGRTDIVISTVEPPSEMIHAFMFVYNPVTNVLYIRDAMNAEWNVLNLGVPTQAFIDAHTGANQGKW